MKRFSLVKHFFLVTTIAILFLAAPLEARKNNIEIVHRFNAATPPGNIAITPKGRIFMSLHEFFGQDVRVVEVKNNGETIPYPNQAWAKAPQSNGMGLNGVLGLRADRNGILWMLDGQRQGHAGRIVAWNTNKESLHQIITLAPPVTRPDSFLNDLAVDREHEFIYIADTASSNTAALIVVNLKTGQARRLLEGSVFTQAEDLDLKIDNRVITNNGKPVRIGVNPITIDPTNEWVYFAPMSSTSLYRIRTQYLRDTSLDDAALAQRVERYGDKPISDGITIDLAGNVYITSITEDAIGVTRADGAYQILDQRDDLSWPDGFAVGPRNYIYATINELHRSPPLNRGQDSSLGEFKIIRFKALADTVTGR
ncbi:MAG: L-dopachrome tautomerase-related protein [Prochloraceae cyanobacterium]|nr:L-dopachrome tautomerase-related protein [Prochloraceae cyanobacterium]